MRKMIQIFGGVLVSAAAVLIVIQIYTGNIFGSLKGGAEKADIDQAQPKDEYEQAVLSDPVFTYTGEYAKKAGEDYNVYEEIKVTDSKDGYESTLKEAVSGEEGDIRIYVKDIKVLELNGEEMQEAAAEIDLDSGSIRIGRSGIYQIKVSGMDKHNNSVKTEFLIAVNRRGE